MLSDHGWHVCYVIQRWLGAPAAGRAGPPRDATAHRLAGRGHRGAVASPSPTPIAEVFLTWAADERRNWALIEGESGRIELRDDTLILTGTRRRAAVVVARRCPTAPIIPTGSARSRTTSSPRWPARSADGANLAEASLCVMVESLARESSRRGGATLGLSPLAIAVDRPLGTVEGDLKIAGDPTVARAVGLLLIVPAGSGSGRPSHTPSRACHC